MQILLRIARMAGRYRTRLVLAYLTFFAAIGFSLLIPRLFGESVDRLVRFDGGQIIPLNPGTSTLLFLALALLGASLIRGFFDFGRTYTTDSLSQKVSFDLRNLLYDKLQHISFAYHDKEGCGCSTGRATRVWRSGKSHRDQSLIAAQPGFCPGSLMWLKASPMLAGPFCEPLQLVSGW